MTPADPSGNVARGAISPAAYTPECPRCGWEYDPKLWAEPGDDGMSSALVPPHDIPSTFGYSFSCPGTRQHPRNPESDRRPPWKDSPGPEVNPWT